MTADSPGSSTPQLPTEQHSSSSSWSSSSLAIAIALIVWLLIQLAAIALAASGVPLSANFPQPPQSLAVHEMLIAQFVGSAMFLSVLFRGGWRAWAATVLTAGPMLMLAAWLARMPMSRMMLPWGEVGLWLTTLALWSAVGAGRNQPKTATFLGVLSALAMLLSAGGLLWQYLRDDARRPLDPQLLRLFPLACGLRHVDDPARLSPLLSTAALCAVALVILAVKVAFRRIAARRKAAEVTHLHT